MKKLTSILGFCCALTSSTIFASMNYATWMSQIPDNKVLNQLIIPGTHDSGTDGIKPNSLFSLSSGDALPIWIEKISNLLPKSLIRPIVAKWSRTQPQSFTQQLNSGIRYFDLRVCNFTATDHTKSFYLCHTLLGDKLDDDLKQIQHFATAYPSETIILDINHLYGISSDTDETKLVSLLKSDLGNVAVSNQYAANSTIGSIRQSHRNVIILMDANYAVTDPATQQFLAHNIWHQSSIRSPWPNVTSVTELKQKLDDDAAFRASNYKVSHSFFVYQMIQTEGTNQIAQGILNPIQYPDSIQRYEAPVDQDITTWLTQYIAQYGPHPINIVMEDWHTGSNGIVALAKLYDTQSENNAQKTDRLDPKLTQALKLKFARHAK